MATRFYSQGRLGSKRSWTPEGFLICHDVALARTGTLLYAPGEVPIDAGKDGIVAITRDPDDVFDPDSMASFEGKPVTNDHPPLGVKVDPNNWRQFAVGDAHNIRRGDGAILDGQCLYGDLMVKDAKAIQDILDGKIEVSAGYDAEYEQLEPGRGRQHEIIGNHVALVDKGRCGPTCSIGDTDTMAKRGNTFDRIMAAFKTRDEGALVQELDKVKDMLGEVISDDMPPELGGGEGNGVNLHFHGVGAPSAGKKGPMSVAEDGDEDPAAAAAPGGAQPGAAPGGPDVGAMMQQLMQRMETVEKAIMLLAQEEEDEDDDEPAAAAESGGGEDVPGKVEDDGAEINGEQKTWPAAFGGAKAIVPGATGDRRRGRVGDSSSLAGDFQEMLSRAAVLAPGYRLPTFDASRGARMTVDAMCNFRRSTLARAWSTDDGREVIGRLYRARKVDFSKDAMTCDAVTVLFNGASELARGGHTQDAARGFAAVMDHGREMVGNVTKTPTIAEINERAAKAWKAQA